MLVWAPAEEYRVVSCYVPGMAMLKCHWRVMLEMCLIVWSEKHLFRKVQGVNVSKVAYWHQNTVRNLSSICECKDPRKIAEVLEILWGPKNKVFNFVNFGVRNMSSQDERISNLVSKLKSDNIWPRLWRKNGRHLANLNLAILRVFDRFRQIFLPKTGSNVVRSKFWDQIWNLLILAHLSGPKM